MLPIGDERTPRRLFPFMTYLLILINAVFFYLELSRGTGFIEQWAFVPSRFLADPLEEFPTIFTAMFMHGGWLHILSNMLYLGIFGDNVEDRFGRIKFIIFYLLSGIVATFAQFAVNPSSSIPVLGASGAIAGVLAAYVLMFPKSPIRVLMGLWVIRVRALFVIGGWFLVQLLSGYALLGSESESGGVAYLAHVGGFIAGFLLTFIFK